MKQTAVEFILEHLNMWLPILHKEGCEVEQIFTEAKALEKQQIVEAHLHGHADAIGEPDYQASEKYYTENYTQSHIKAESE